MKTQYLIAAALAAVAVFLIAKSSRVAGTGTGAAALLSTLANQQVTLANGSVIDIGSGVIFDPVTGNYTRVSTGEIVYRGG